VRVWEFGTGKVRHEFKANVGPDGFGWYMGPVSFAPDGRLVAAGDAGGNVQVWDLDSRQEMEGRKVTYGGEAGIYSLSYSADGKLLVAGNGDGEIIAWDVAKKSEAWRIKAHKGAVSSIAVSPTGKYLTSSGYDKTVKIWDMSALPPKK
jgi:WD40 repeat protein